MDGRCGTRVDGGTLVAMPVRLTLHPGEDVELPDGARLGDLRPSLADLARRPELLHRPLQADGTVVEDDGVAGARPLLAGATLRPAGTPQPEAPDVAALRSPWFLAAATGPRAGEPVPLTGAMRLGPVTVRVGARGRVRVRPTRPAWPLRRRSEPAVLVTERSGRERRRPVRMPCRWRPGALLEVDGTRYAVHPSGQVDLWLAPPEPDGGPGSTPPWGMLATGLVPVVGSIALAVAFRQPLYALFSLVAVVGLLPQLLARRRRQGSGPAAQDVGTAAGRVPQPVGTEPARTALRVVAAHQASPAAWRRARQTLARSARDRTGDPPDPATPAELLPDGALAVRGPLDAVRATARSVVLDLAAAGADVTVAGTGRDSWSWCRWIAPGEDERPRVLVVDGADRAGRAAADTAARRGDAVVLCLPSGAGDPASVPSWCRAVVDLDGRGGARRRAPDGTDVVTRHVGVSAAWAERTARRLAGLRGLGRSLTTLADAARGIEAAATVPPAEDRGDPADRRLPTAVALGALLPTDDPAPRWARAEGWSIPLGCGADGDPVPFDLVADGPHLLVAGTTGAGKSELLQSLVLGLALTRSPADLSFALVDFKGGASFGRCADLPHVVGQVTDLEPGLAGRALAGLRAELRRREHVLARHRVASLDDAPPGTLGRLVVVIDEFRALADDLPEFLPGLLRVAAQGRSLGVHLVLATQRPAGAVGTDVRANVSARIALRVVDAADSHDVVDTAAAARIPVSAPGRAVLRVGSDAPVALQCAHAGATPDAAPAVRRAPSWRSTGPDPDGRSGHLDGPGATPERAAARTEPVSEDPVARTVDRIRQAAARQGHRPGPPPWLPPLPEDVDPDSVPADVADHPEAGLLLALGDEPDRQRRTLVRWQPSDGHLAVLGGARSGRTTALLRLAVSALDTGRPVHALVPASAAALFAPLLDHPGFGTLAGPEDPRRARRLLTLLDRGGPSECLVVVDDVAEMRAVLAGSDPWDPLATAVATGSTAFAMSADSAHVGGLASRTGPRLVLLGGDQHADVMRGAPTAMAGTGGVPGRAAWMAGGDPVTCQVLRPTPPQAPAGPRPEPPRVLPLPTTVDPADLALDGIADTPGTAGAPGPAEDPDSAEGLVPLGIGGDAAGPVGLDVRAGALVVGPRGSGRTAALVTITRWAAGRGLLEAVVTRDETLRTAAGDARTCRPHPDEVRALVGGLGRSPGWVIVDDVDALAQSCPVEAETLGAAMLDGLTVIGSSTTQGALMAHRGALAELRGRRTGVVLSPSDRGAEEVFGVGLSDAADAGPPRPGRGALVADGRVVPVQLVLPTAT